MQKSILIVEDNKTNMRFFTDLLKRHKFKTILSNDGSDAVELSISEHPDLIIMDIQLPGMSGTELTRIIKNDPQTENIPIIAVTAFSIDDNDYEIDEAGFDAFVAKPIKIDDFIDTINRLLETGP
ncbi:MAG: response regulator [Rhodospirillaceae bacterium]|nr:response regulator [Rhodospirillaceae bacterium]